MAQGEKRENSVLFSLRELREIEENRVQEEENAVRKAEEARRMAQEAAERARRAEEDARIQAERDHQRSIEEARLAAEREARMRVESAEAAERQRHQAALEQQRLAQEMELRRAEVAKKRPTWMLVVTGLAVVGAIALTVVGIWAYNNSKEADARAAEAQRLEEEHAKEVKQLQANAAKLQQDSDEIQARLDKAIADVGNARDAAELKAAQERLMALNKEKAEMNARLAQAKAAAEKAERAKGVHISKECQENPLAKGCS